MSMDGRRASADDWGEDEVWCPRCGTVVDDLAAHRAVSPDSARDWSACDREVHHGGYTTDFERDTAACDRDFEKCLDCQRHWPKPSFDQHKESGLCDRVAGLDGVSS